MEDTVVIEFINGDECFLDLIVRGISTRAYLKVYSDKNNLLQENGAEDNSDILPPLLDNIIDQSSDDI